LLRAVRRKGREPLPGLQGILGDECGTDSVAAGDGIASGGMPASGEAIGEELAVFTRGTQSGAEDAARLGSEGQWDESNFSGLSGTGHVNLLDE
jgi:hypothetical protein